MQAEVKREILLMVHRAKEKGVKLTRSCEILQLPLQRYCAWSRRDREEKLDGVSDPLLDGKPGPAPDKAPHGLLREEKEQISALLRDETYADLPPHQLAVVASEKGVVQASASSFSACAPCASHSRLPALAYVTDLLRLRGPARGVGQPATEVPSGSDRVMSDCGLPPSPVSGE